MARWSGQPGLVKCSKTEHHLEHQQSSAGMGLQEFKLSTKQSIFCVVAETLATMSSLTCSPASSVFSRTSSSSKRAVYASFKPAVSARQARVRVNAASQDNAAGSIDRRSMLAFSAVLPLMLQQSAMADEGKCPSCLTPKILVMSQYSSLLKWS